MADLPVEPVGSGRPQWTQDFIRDYGSGGFALVARLSPFIDLLGGRHPREFTAAELHLVAHGWEATLGRERALALMAALRELYAWLMSQDSGIGDEVFQLAETYAPGGTPAATSQTQLSERQAANAARLREMVVRVTPIWLLAPAAGILLGMTAVPAIIPTASDEYAYSLWRLTQLYLSNPARAIQGTGAVLMSLAGDTVLLGFVMTGLVVAAVAGWGRATGRWGNRPKSRITDGDLVGEHGWWWRTRSRLCPQLGRRLADRRGDDHLARTLVCGGGVR
jgi:hypothetical protein